MKRFVFAAVVGLCSFAPLAAQEGTLAPTVPMVPAPVVQNGNLINPAGNRQPLFTMPKWSPLKSPVAAANTAEPTPPPMTGPAMPPYSKYAPTTPPPLPTGAVDAPCGPAGCTPKHDRSCWAHFKAWLCYAPSKSDLPKCQPVPYTTPLQGMFPCTANCGYGCATGHCGGQYPAMLQQPVPTQPMLPPMGQPNLPLKMPAPRPVPAPMAPAPSVPVPMPMPTPPSASPVLMPPRGVSGAPTAPMGEVRAAPVAAPVAPMSNPATAGTRFASPYATNNWKPAPQPGSVVPASGTQK